MTHMVLRSRIPDENAFACAVENHARELKSYASHCEKVAKGEAQHYPFPTAAADVDASVRRSDFTSDYMIVDFIPVEKGDIGKLNLRKEELLQLIASMELAAIHAILPRGKWRLAGLEYSTITKKKLDQRSEQEQEIVVTHEMRMQHVNDIQMHHARMESEIEDLNFDTINQWVPTPYQS